jgi:hypothetical protein
MTQDASNLKQDTSSDDTYMCHGVTHANIIIKLVLLIHTIKEFIIGFGFFHLTE